MYLETYGEKAKKAKTFLSLSDTKAKDMALAAMADALVKKAGYIIESNTVDLENAKRNNIKASLIDRLNLNHKRIGEMAKGLKDIALLDDPIGEIMETIKRPNGLVIEKTRVPIGVIGIIYEARPNVTSDAAGLCFKTGNAVILRGGSEAINSNKAIVSVLNTSLKESGFPEGCIQLVEDTSREVAMELMKLNRYIDLLIPRGGYSLINTVLENATVPVIETGVGNCHVYIDDTADINMGVSIIENAKTTRPSVCNAAETLLVHESIAVDFLPKAQEILKKSNVELRGCEKTLKIINDVIPATEEDWETEYLDYILAVKIVGGLDEAIEHINKYGTLHSEAIVTGSDKNARDFTQKVDAAAVYVNSSTRFTDGGEFGFGAEIGISTQKIHARGPMGLKELTSYKYVITGNGQIR